ncbi:hypothetical protein GOV10_03425 [Candidatus Woesearchaeota archaeon]|nr:hypothetical protein [Candidatus Woesearchaeota archaeon]
MTKTFKIKFKGKEIVASNEGLDTLQLLVSTSSEDYPPQLSVSAHGDYSNKEHPVQEKTWIIENLNPGDSFEFTYVESGETSEPIRVHDVEPFKELCFFCGKSKNDVEILIEGKKILTSYICNECVDTCIEVIRKERAKKKST